MWPTRCCRSSGKRWGCAAADHPAGHEPEGRLRLPELCLAGSRPGHRKLAEFCENGAKAVAWEATTQARRRRRSSPPTRRRAARRHDDHWLEPARPAAPSRCTSRRAPRTTRRSPGTTPSAWSPTGCRRWTPEPRRSSTPAGARQQRGRVPLPALRARRFGTNNLPDCSNMCHESSGAALTETIGIGKGTVTLDDFRTAPTLIFVVGQNPGTNHPRMLTALEAAKRRGATHRRRSTRCPRRGFTRFNNPQTATGVLGPRHHARRPASPGPRQRRPGAASGGLNRVAAGAEDAAPAPSRPRVHRAATATASRRPEARLAGRSTGRAVESRQRLDRAGRSTASPTRLVRAERVIVCWAMGLTQHRNAVPTIREIVNFLLLRGNIGRPGAGPCPVRGHSNVQGDRTMGIWERHARRSSSTALGAEFGFRAARARHRRRRLDPGDARRRRRVFFALGGNFLRAARPDTVGRRRPRSAATALTVHVATKLNRSHLCTGDAALILPCLGRTEIATCRRRGQFVTVEDTTGMVHASHGRLAPASAPSSAARSRSSPRLGSALFGRTVGWMEMGRDYRLHPRAHRARACPGSTTRRPALGRAGRVRALPPRPARLGRSRRTPARPTSPSTPADRCTCPRATCSCRPCARTTSSTPPSTASTTATAA